MDLFNKVENGIVAGFCFIVESWCFLKSSGSSNVAVVVRQQVLRRSRCFLNWTVFFGIFFIFLNPAYVTS